MTSPAPSITVGDDLPPFDLDVTTTVIVAGALASQDFMPVHHDRDFAQAQGAPDIFMNILSTNGYVARYVTDWAGPEAMLRSLRIRLGAQATPGQRLRFSGTVTEVRREADETWIEVSVQADCAQGAHATGTAALTLPAGRVDARPAS